MPSPPITFLYGQAVPRCTHDIDKVFEDYCTLQYMAGGDVSLTVGQTAHALAGRWFWSCYPGPRIAFHPARPGDTWNHRYIAFRGPIVKAWERDGLFPIRPQRPPHEADYGLRFDELLALSRRPGHWSTRRAMNLLETILIELAEARETTAADPLVERAVQLLHDSAYTLDSPALAAELGISERTLRRRFTATMGMSPRDYVLHQRVTSAMVLLAETSMPIKQIAHQLAYRDIFYFTRQFRAISGTTPARYRRSSMG